MEGETHESQRRRQNRLDALIDVEDAIQNARRCYNAAVRGLTTRMQSVPDLLVARVFALREHEFLQLGHPDEATAPRVNLEGVG